MKKIVLTGFMGVGKTTVGRIVAKKLGINFVDTDEYIEEQMGKPVSKIFEEEGEETFRKKEVEVFNDFLCADEPSVISTGGGTFSNPEMRDKCKKESISICLVTSFEKFTSRIEKLKKDRPLLRNKSIEEIKELFDIRSVCYIDANEHINIDDMTPEQVADKVVKIVKSST